MCWAPGGGQFEDVGQARRWTWKSRKSWACALARGKRSWQSPCLSRSRPRSRFAVRGRARPRPHAPMLPHPPPPALRCAGRGIDARRWALQVTCMGSTMTCYGSLSSAGFLQKPATSSWATMSIVANRCGKRCLSCRGWGCRQGWRVTPTSRDVCRPSLPRPSLPLSLSNSLLGV